MKKTIRLLPLAIHAGGASSDSNTETNQIGSGDLYANKTAENNLRDVARPIHSRSRSSRSIYYATKDGLDELKKGHFNVEELNEVDHEEGVSALHLAVRENQLQTITALVSRQVDVDIAGRDGVRPLHLAARHNFIDAAKILLKNNADVTIANNQGSTPLHFAARRDNLEVSELLLQEPALFVDQQDHDGFTPTHIACINGSVGLCELLLSHNARVQISANDGKTALHMASYQGNSDVIKLLIKKAQEKNCDIYSFVNCADLQYYTPLHYAASNGHTSAAAVLIDHGAQVDADTVGLCKPLHLAAIGGHQGVTELLLTQGARVNDVDTEQRTALHRASTFGRESVIRVLLENGGKVDARDEQGMTPLLYAVQRGNFETADLLLENNAHVGIQDISSKTCLHYAIDTRNLAGIQLLMNQGANCLLEVTDNTDQTPLHYAASLGDIKTVRLLIENGCDVNPKDETQQTPLHLASSKGNLEVVEELMKRTPLDSSDESNRTPLHFAAMNGKRKICLSLIQMGAKLDAQDQNRQSPLHLAARQGQERTVRAVLDNGASIDLIDKNKNTALHHAAARGHVAVVNLLLQNEANVLIQNIAGQTCFDVAIDNSEDVAMEMVQHTRWQEILSSKSKNRPLPMNTLIANLPDVAEEVMNRCVQVNDLVSKTDPDYSVTYNFRLLDPGSDSAIPLNKDHKFFGPAVMVKHKREMLLTHPLCTRLLGVKWSKFGRWPYYLNLFFFILFIAFFTLYVVNKRENIKSSYGVYILDSTGEGLYGFGLYVMIFASIQILIEMGQLVIQGRMYFTSIQNYIDWLMYVSCFLFIAPNLKANCCLKNFSIVENNIYWSIGILALVLTWSNLFLMLRQLTSVGIYFSMLIDVTKTVVKVFFTVFAIFTALFSIIFHILLYEQPEFNKFLYSVIKVTVMTIGEMDYTSTIFDNLNANTTSGDPVIPQKEATLIMFYIFSILMPIILMNLLIGLAVGDIDTIQKNAQMEKLAMTVNYVTEIESKYPHAIARRLNIAELVMKPNKTHIKSCWQSFVFRIQSLFRKTTTDVGFEWEEDETPEETDDNKIQRELKKQRQKMKKMSLLLEKQHEMLEYIKNKIDGDTMTSPLKRGSLNRGVTSPPEEEEISSRIDHHHSDSNL